MLNPHLKNVPGYILKPVPLFVFRPLVLKISSHIVKKRPGLFSRLGPHTNKIFLIDPINMPFVIVMRPDPKSLSITLHRAKEEIKYDASISGTFMNLLHLVDGGVDGDSLFFNRDLKVGGDTEAVVCLRNALDDVDGSMTADIAEIFGTPGSKALSILRKLRA